VYSLTSLTGRHRNANRRMHIVGFETKRATFIVCAISVAASAPLTLILGVLFGFWALATPLVFAIAGVYLFDARQTRGMKLVNYQAILDTRRARNGILYAAGAPIPHARLILHQPVVVPAMPQTPAPAIVPRPRGRREAFVPTIDRELFNA